MGLFILNLSVFEQGSFFVFVDAVCCFVSNNKGLPIVCFSFLDLINVYLYPDERGICGHQENAHHQEAGPAPRQTGAV